MGAKKVTPEQVEEMKFMENDLHMSRRDIAKEIGVSADVITYYLGVKQPSSGNRISKNTLERMQQLRAKGLSNKQIAIEVGCAYETVHRRLGNQPDNNRSDYGSIVAHVTGESFVKEKEVRKLQQISMCVTFAGKDWTYEATDKGFVKISAFAGCTIDLDIHQLENLMDELNEVHGWIKKHDTTPVILLDGKPKSQEKQLPL